MNTETGTESSSSEAEMSEIPQSEQKKKQTRPSATSPEMTSEQYIQNILDTLEGLSRYVSSHHKSRN